MLVNSGKTGAKGRKKAAPRIKLAKPLAKAAPSRRRKKPEPVTAVKRAQAQENWNRRLREANAIALAATGAIVDEDALSKPSPRVRSTR